MLEVRKRFVERQYEESYEEYDDVFFSVVAPVRHDVELEAVRRGVPAHISYPWLLDHYSHH